MADPSPRPRSELIAQWRELLARGIERGRVPVEEAVLITETADALEDYERRVAAAEERIVALEGYEGRVQEARALIDNYDAFTPSAFVIALNAVLADAALTTPEEG